MPSGLRLSLGITGHRESNGIFASNRQGIETALADLFSALDKRADPQQMPRLHSLLAMGTDLMAVETALARGWQVAAPLPFGFRLNLAINAQPETEANARALLSGDGACDEAVAARAAHIERLAHRTHLFALGEQDAMITDLFLTSLADPLDETAAEAFSVAASERAAMAGKVMIEQADMIIAIWDGASPGPVGGTRHTIIAALEQGLPVVWINAEAPEEWRILSAPESMAVRKELAPIDRETGVDDLVSSLTASANVPMGDPLGDERWHGHSHRWFHAYRRIEALFGGSPSGKRIGSLVQHYESPEAIVTGSAATLLGTARALPGGDATLATRIEEDVIIRFARADGVSTYLSDAYRGSMVANLLLSAFAIIGGVAYLPFASPDWKWPFALFEFVLLAAILIIIAVGRRRRWHGRWFETRRVAEYLRHAPLMLLLGVTRPASSWPRGSETDWPETYVRSILREIGLPKITLTSAYLREALTQWRAAHVSVQCAYHRAKARRLYHVHHSIERSSEWLFSLAIFSVAAYLAVVLLCKEAILPEHWVHDLSKPFTFLGVLFPTLGGALAGIHYFADFERFGAISQSTADRLEAVDKRIGLLLGATDSELRYGRVADLARAVDDMVIAEIGHWQDVFGGKHITVPV